MVKVYGFTMVLQWFLLWCTIIWFTMVYNIIFSAFTMVYYSSQCFLFGKSNYSFYYGSTIDLQWLCMRFGLNWIDHVLLWCCYGFMGFCPGFATGLTIEVLRFAKHFTSMMHTRTMRTIPRDTKYLSQQFSKTIDHRRPLSWSNSWTCHFE